VGYLQGSGANATWNFDAGRYDAFQGLRGVVTDPQTGEPVADGTVTMLALLLSVPPETRESALALADAARIAAEGMKGARALALAEAAARMNPACLPAWDAMQGVAEKGWMSQEQKQKWAQASSRLCGQRFPDFQLEALRPMVASEKDAAAQDRMWNALAMEFERRRPDLASEVRISQAMSCEERGQVEDAVKRYQMAADKQATAGVAAVAALYRMAALLQKNDRTAQAIGLVDGAWRRMPRPDGALMYRTATTWFRTGLLLSELLESAGKSGEAQRVMSDLMR
jgi:hypothetical protein